MTRQFLWLVCLMAGTLSCAGSDWTTLPNGLEQLCEGSLCFDYAPYGGDNGDGAWMIAYDKNVSCKSAVIWFHGGMFPVEAADLEHTADVPRETREDIKRSVGTIGDVMADDAGDTTDFLVNQGGRVVAVGAVNRTAGLDARGAWAPLIHTLVQDMGCEHIVSTSGSSGGWAAIELARVFGEVEGAVVANSAVNIPFLAGLYEQYLQDYSSATPQSCTDHITDIRRTCEVNERWCDQEQLCMDLQFLTRWVSQNLALFEQSIAGPLPRATDSLFSSRDPYQKEIYSVFSVDADSPFQEGNNRDTDLAEACGDVHSLITCEAGRRVLRDKVIALVEGAW